MNKILSALLVLLCSSQLYADCNEFALHGDWTVFYRDNAFPTSVLAADEIIEIRYRSEPDRYSIALSDKKWKAWSGGWTHDCINGQTVLLGAVEKRGRGLILVVEISRVTDVNDLLPGPSGEIKLNQINIHFPEPYAYNGEALFETAEKEGYLASHPGHAHGDN